MGLGGVSIWQLLIILLIVVLVFGTKKIRTIGGDLGGAIRAFRKSVEEPEREAEEPSPKLESRSGGDSTLDRNEQKADSSH
jgi:sec-independent protein translocase protein TatA